MMRTEIRRINGRDIEVTESSSNIFADMGLPDAVDRQAKVRLAVALYHIVKARRLKQSEVARILGIAQPKVSALLGGKLEGFSLYKLIEFLTALNNDVDIVIKPRRAKAGAGKITVLSQ